MKLAILGVKEKTEEDTEYDYYGDFDEYTVEIDNPFDIVPETFSWKGKGW